MPLACVSFGPEAGRRLQWRVGRPARKGSDRVDAVARRSPLGVKADRLDVAIIGAGPFGLSVAAHLRGLAVRTFGEQLRTWRHCMPRDMHLRSSWDQTSLSAPGGASLDEWAAATGQPRQEPIPLQVFLRYASWFAARFVPESDPNDVALVELNRSGYRITTTAGDETDANHLVLAVGVTPFAYVPPSLAELLGSVVTLSTDSPDGRENRGTRRRVLVVGGGQAGLESAGLAARAGAEVELVTRSRLRWFKDREPYNPRGPVARRIYKLAYPAVGYGPPVLNRLVLHPDSFPALPAPLRRRLTGRVLRSGGSPWLRTFVEDNVRISERCGVERVQRRNGHLSVRLTDGAERDVDEVIVACGYRFDLGRLSFLSPEVRARIDVRDGWPVLDRLFRSSDPRLQFVGYPAESRFGPLSRFVMGAGFTAGRVAESFGR
jgi:FAD-dependent urate hydroxylase